VGRRAQASRGTLDVHARSGAVARGALRRACPDANGSPITTSGAPAASSVGHAQMRVTVTSTGTRLT